MARDDPFPGLEAIVAHGARMSWTGLERPGDEFPAARRCRRAVLRSESGPALRRGFGTWSGRYRRYTTQLSSPSVSVWPLEPDARAREGVQTLLHWVPRRSFEHTGPGSVCAGDGWPVALWERFLADPGRDRALPLATALRRFLDSDASAEHPVVAAWRAAVSGHRGGNGRGLVPVPARLVLPEAESDCLLSWSPGAPVLASLTEALTGSAAPEGDPDLAAQARYYLECTLGRFHGVEFGPADSVPDAEFERSEAYRGLAVDLEPLERRRIAERGRLDRLG
jgi:hypothetical protein